MITRGIILYKGESVGGEMARKSSARQFQKTIDASFAALARNEQNCQRQIVSKDKAKVKLLRLIAVD